jgi:hypothetical protein
MFPNVLGMNREDFNTPAIMMDSMIRITTSCDTTATAYIISLGLTYPHEHNKHKAKLERQHNRLIRLLVVG